MANRIERFGSKLELALDILEIMVFAALATAMIIGVIMLLEQTVTFAVLVAHPGASETMQNVHTDGGKNAIMPFEASYVKAKNMLLAALDTALILIIGLDILRTLAVAVIQREMHLAAALEAGILAMVREVIGAEVRHKSIYALLSYAVIIVMLAGIWLIIRRETVKARISLYASKVEESRGSGEGEG